LIPVSARLKSVDDAYGRKVEMREESTQRLGIG
jgi:hypothetical protein